MFSLECFCWNIYRLEHPVKRLKKGDSKLESKPAYNPSKHMPASEHLLAKVRAERDTPPSPATPAHDPYEFSDEASSTPGEFSKRASLRQSREDSITRPNSFITKLVGSHAHYQRSGWTGTWWNSPIWISSVPYYMEEMLWVRWWQYVYGIGISNVYNMYMSQVNLWWHVNYDECKYHVQQCCQQTDCLKQASLSLSWLPRFLMHFDRYLQVMYS